MSSLPAPGGWTDLLGDLDTHEERLLLDGLPDDHVRVEAAYWPGWAHRGQLAPEGDWRTWVLMAGRGFGKTLAGAQWIRALVEADAAAPETPGQSLAIALVGATIDDARLVMVEGRSGLLHVAADLVRDWQPSLRRLTFTSGAEAVLFSGASPDRLRGPEHHFAWCDELAKWDKPQETWDMIQFGLRLGPHPRALITTTPRPGPVLSAIMAQPDTQDTHGPTGANPHLPPAFLRRVHALYAGTRLGRQEIDGELLTNVPGALWTVELLASCRAQGSDWAAIARQRVEPASADQPASRSGDRTDVTDPLRDGLSGLSFPQDQSTTLIRVVIGVDPPSGDGTCGIVACGKDADGRAHVLADHSVTGRSPEGWSRAVADAARLHAAASAEGRVLVVAEQNQGGRMVKAVLHNADPNLWVKPVTAAVGKAERAAPVAQLFEAGRVVLHGRFEALEAQLLGMIAGGGYEGPGQSPDRADAMVWALTELMLSAQRAPQVRAL